MAGVTLHVLTGLHPLTQHLMAGADVLVLQQMDQRQGANVVRLLSLPAALIGRLSTLGPFQVLVVSRGGMAAGQSGVDAERGRPAPLDRRVTAPSDGQWSRPRTARVRTARAASSTSGG